MPLEFEKHYLCNKNLSLYLTQAVHLCLSQALHFSTLKVLCFLFGPCNLQIQMDNTKLSQFASGSCGDKQLLEL